jgi:hypothetical protein
MEKTPTWENTHSVGKQGYTHSVKTKILFKKKKKIGILCSFSEFYLVVFKDCSTFAMR